MSRRQRPLGALLGLLLCLQQQHLASCGETIVFQTTFGDLSFQLYHEAGPALILCMWTLPGARTDACMCMCMCAGVTHHGCTHPQAGQAGCLQHVRRCLMFPHVCCIVISKHAQLASDLCNLLCVRYIAALGATHSEPPVAALISSAWTRALSLRRQQCCNAACPWTLASRHAPSWNAPRTASQQSDSSNLLLAGRG